MSYTTKTLLVSKISKHWKSYKRISTGKQQQQQPQQHTMAHIPLHLHHSLQLLLPVQPVNEQEE
jgi:hypothetical protein